jgi:NitT/TauT family transport system permease protein
MKAGIGASIVLLIAFLAAWEWLPGLLGIPPYFIPPVSSVYQEFVRSFGPERLLYHTGLTALETAVGFIIGSLMGMVIGYVLGISARLEFVLSPYILALQIAPKVAFAPLFLLWFGYTLYPTILVAILIVFFPIMVNVLSAVRNVDPDLINLARTFNASRWQIFRMIEFHDALPPLFSGLRIGATLAVIGVVVGEMVRAKGGLGAVLIFGEGQANTALVFVAIILLTVVGIAAYAAVVLLERRVLHYLPSKQYAPV